MSEESRAVEIKYMTHSSFKILPTHRHSSMERIGKADQHSIMGVVYNCGHDILYGGITRDGNLCPCMKLFNLDSARIKIPTVECINPHMHLLYNSHHHIKDDICCHLG